MSLLLLLTSLPVLLGGALLALFLRTNRARALAAIASQALACALVCSDVVPVLRGVGELSATWPWPAPIETIVFRVDALGAFFLAWSLPLTLLATIYATGYLQPYFERGQNGGTHFALLNLTALSFVLIYSVQNALVFLLGWEVAAVAAWLMVIFDYRNQKIRFAGFNYLVSTHVGFFVLVAAFMLLHGATDSMDLSDFGRFLAQPSEQRGTLFLLLGVAFALKSAFFPFHTWLPRAHSAAPAHVSALMSGVIHKAGLFGFLRFTLLAGRPEEWMGWSVLAFGLCSALFGVLYTPVQRDLKRLLGYSSTENVGIAAIGFGAGYLGWTWDVPLLTACGFGGGILHLLNHALFKCLLFYAAGAVYRATHTVDLERLGGLARRLPRTALLFLLAAMASAALPPLNGFASEFLIYSALFSGAAREPEASVALVAVAALLAFVGAVSLLAMLRAFGLTFLGLARDPHVHVGADAPRRMAWPMLLHALAIIALGLAPELGLSFLRRALELFPVGAAADELAARLAPVVWAGRALAFVLALASWLAWRAGRDARRAATWGCGYTAPSARMQYTGSSFSEHFARVFETFLPTLRREHLPVEPFPQHSGRLDTHHVDAVERRMFEVLGQGEDMLKRSAERVPDQPRLYFAVGLVALMLVGAWVLAGVGA